MIPKDGSFKSCLPTISVVFCTGAYIPYMQGGPKTWLLNVTVRTQTGETDDNVV